eukprot:NODE_181_length_13917_cov_0.838110.p8 type:complete len:282 gc:universal NODE_181_length_13917_cov_0.838110:6648-7493(+)
MDNNIVVNDYRQMDKILKEERAYLLNICKIIKKSGCNVLLIQKSILRDSVTDLSLHFLSKLKIMVITDIEREEVGWLCKSTGCKPIADIDSFQEDKLGVADVVAEVESAGCKYVTIQGVKSPNTRKTASVVVHGANNLVVDEAERSIHDAMCVIRCLVKKPFLIAGGGAPEMQVSNKLLEMSKSDTGLKSHCYEAFSNAVQVIPSTLAENAGLPPLKIVSQLKKSHVTKDAGTGINVKRGTVENMWNEDVVQPLLVSTSELELAADTVRMIMKIDDIVQAR